jgi:hypothetical protein
MRAAEVAIAMTIRLVATAGWHKGHVGGLYTSSPFNHAPRPIVIDSKRNGFSHLQILGRTSCLMVGVLLYTPWLCSAGAIEWLKIGKLDEEMTRPGLKARG